MMKAIPIKLLFSVFSLLRRSVADFEEVLQNYFNTDDGKRNIQFVFPYNYTLFEATLFGDDGADAVVFHALHGLADPRPAKDDAKELEGLLEILPRRIEGAFPTFFDTVEMKHEFDRTKDRKLFLRVYFVKKEERP